MHYDWYGIFQGGMIPLSPDSEDESYSCLRQMHRSSPQLLIQALPSGYTTPSTTTFPPDKDPGHCVEWSASEKDKVTLSSKKTESEYGTCFCFQSPQFTPWLRVKASPHFCTQWSCSQTEVGSQVHNGNPYYYQGSTGYSSYRTYYSHWDTEREI